VPETLRVDDRTGEHGSIGSADVVEGDLDRVTRRAPTVKEPTPRIEHGGRGGDDDEGPDDESEQ